MGIDSFITDGFGSGLKAHVHKLPGGSDHAGVVALTSPLLQFNPEFHPFLNETYGRDMNQNVAFSDTPELIHDGTDNAGWTGAAVSGTWDFSDTSNPSADTNCVSITSADNNDSATFADGTSTDTSAHTAMTGQIRLETFNSVNHDILLQFQNGNVALGGTVDLVDYIDPDLLNAYQGFVIPLADFALPSVTVDEVVMTVQRSGGARPTFRFDEWQIEQTGTPAVFKATTPLGTRYHIDQFRFSFADALAGTLLNNSMPALAYNKILGVTSLPNGVVFQRVQNGRVNFSVVLSQLSDFLGSGGDITNLVSDGTNTYMTIEIAFNEPIVLEGGEDENFLSLTVSDNLSGLLLFRAAARGSVEI